LSTNQTALFVLSRCTKMRDVIIDTNVFVLYLAGRINTNQIYRYCRNALYTEDDYHFLVNLLGNFDRIITCPNVLTEIDNLLNRITGDDKYTYLLLAKEIYTQSIEKYIATDTVSKEWYFSELGLTDSVLLMMASDSDLLISADSALCDYAKSMGIETFDFKEYLNEKLLLS